MCIRETAVPLRGQAPEAFRATDFTRLVLKGDEALRTQLGKVLTDADHGDAKGPRQRTGRQRTARFKCVEEPAAAAACSQPIKKLIAFLIGIIIKQENAL